MFISIIVTVKNEERHIKHLLDSLVIQEMPFEILIIDSDSTDHTPRIVNNYMKRYDFIRYYNKPGTRGYSRNIGVNLARGEVVAFTDGDCIANPFWLKKIRETIRAGADIVAGKTIQLGYHAFEMLERVELYYRGFDVTYPSCNLAYKKKVFIEAGGFDDWFVTAEDIDLNYRAVHLGYKIMANEEAIIYHRARDTFIGFFEQAFWNGYGRKQLTLKHGSLWKNYKFIDMLKMNNSFWKIVRLFFAVMGFLVCKIEYARCNIYEHYAEERLRMDRSKERIEKRKKKPYVNKGGESHEKF